MERTRVFFTRLEDLEEILRTHGQLFAEIRSASTAVVVKGRIDPRWRVEIEADSVIDR